MLFYIETLGCPKNTVDSEVLDSLLRSHGHEPAPAFQEADVILINTCGFIDAAKEESISTILAFASQKRNGQRLMAIGCLAERFREELIQSIPELDQVLGIGQGQELLDVRKQRARPSCAARSRRLARTSKWPMAAMHTAPSARSR